MRTDYETMLADSVDEVIWMPFDRYMELLMDLGPGGQPLSSYCSPILDASQEWEAYRAGWLRLSIYTERGWERREIRSYDAS